MPNDGSISKLIKQFTIELLKINLIDCYKHIFRSKVPLLKIIETTTKTSMDISFNVADGYCSVKPITALTIKYPPLRSLVIVMKAFLRQRSLNDTYTNGIGSYLLVILVTAFLQYDAKVSKREKTLGELLIDLLTFYGEKFNYREQGISILGDGTLFYKPTNNEILVVENPQSPEENIGYAVNNFKTIADNFKIAREHLIMNKYSLGSIITPSEQKKVESKKLKIFT